MIFFSNTDWINILGKFEAIKTILQKIDENVLHIKIISYNLSNAKTKSCSSFLVVLVVNVLMPKLLIKT